MNSIEERLWSYIDGNCSAQEQQEIGILIERNEVYKQKYNELLEMNNEFAGMELEEPSMAFTYNVMETIRTENARQPLKAAINKRIILGVAIFFIVTISALVILALSSISWQGTITTGVKMPQLNIAPVTGYFTGPVVKGFLFFDVVIGMFLLDAYVRRKNVIKAN